MHRALGVLGDRTISKGQQSWTLALVAFGLALFAPGLFASPLPCAVGTVASYVGSTCTIDGYTVNDFSFSDSSTGGAPLLSSSEITVNPTITPLGISFQFLGAFDIASGTAEYIVQYDLDPLRPQVPGIDINLGPSDPVTLTGQFCGNGLLTGPYVAGEPTSCSGTDVSGIFPTTLQTTGDNTSASASFPTLVTDLDSRLVLDLDGPASTQWFGSNVYVPNASSVPEPSTALWLVPGMFGLLWLRKKRLTNGQ
jgi:hypothetical protein